MSRGELRFALLRAVKAHHLQVRHGIVGIARTSDALLAGSGAGMVRAATNVAMSQGFAGALVAGNDASLTSSGGMVVAAGNRLELHGGGGGVLFARSAHVEDATVPLAIARHLTFSGHSRVLLTTPQAVALGVGFGIALAAAASIIRRWYG